MKGSDISIVVPVLNEIEGIADLCRRLDAGDFEQIVIVDGGSIDGSWQWLYDHWHYGQKRLVLQSESGRAVQMNHGAESAIGDVLIFLHADSRLPNDAKLQVRKVLNGPLWWGRFDVQFDSSLRFMRVIAWFMNTRSKLSGIATGDQAIFMRRAAFEQIQGFDPIPLMEDVATSRRLKGLSKPLCVDSPVVTSARRWERNGVLRTMVLMWAFRFAYFVGVSPQRLSKLYAQVR